MRHKKRVCIALQTGLLLGLLLILPVVLKSGSTAFAEISPAGPSVEEAVKAEDVNDSFRDSSLGDSAHDDSATDDDAGVESESSAEAADLSSYSTLDTGTYFLTSTLSGHRVLDVAGGSVGAGVAIQLYGRNETAAQQFILEDLGDARYAFTSMFATVN